MVSAVLEEMMRPTVSMLFLAAVLHLPTGQGQNSYSRLQPAVKTFVDLAIDNANQQLNYGHLNFYKIGDIKQVSPHQVKIDVRLWATTCRKAKEHRHRPECPFKLLQVRCFVCSRDQHTSEPFIDCVRRRDEKTRHAIWDKHCKSAPLKGQFSLLVADSPSVTITTHLIFKDLICYSGDGGDYRGTVARTISGKTCQRWSARKPHIHDRTPENYPCKGLDNNYCRNPDNERMPWCYTTDRQTRWEYCDVPRCVGVPQPALEPTMFPEMTCFTCEGVNYRGTVSRTISGKTCQRWSDQTPHSHGRTLENYPHIGLDNNYCRNPDNEMMPWCYTTDSQTRWEYCQIPRCGDPPQPDAPQPEPPTIVPEMTCYSVDGSNYRGTVARTISGKTCQSWSDQTPHRHQRTPTNYPCNDLDNNYCRNPDNERMPWCYTTDSQTRWEDCQIPTCDGVPEPASEPTIVPELTCFSCKGVNYRGTVARTISGKTCQRWSAQTPHSHVRTPEDYPHKGLDSNYCRNPDNERMPWCYTTDSRTRWEYCDVPRCGVPKPASQFSQCGKLGSSLLVFGGRQSSPGDHPWQASVQTRTAGSSEPFRHSCGGVLIDSCWVLTAAHCINSSKDMQVVLGGVDLDIAMHEESDQVIPVERPIIHHEYRASSYAVHGDVALLQLQVTDSPLCAKETAYVKTACLPTQLFPNGTECVDSGWGRTETQRRPDKLSNAVVPLISQHRCMAPHVYGDRLDDTMICAGYLAGEVDACKGDSGGPLMCHENGVHYVTGTVSWAHGCALKDKPGVYANIYKYRDWITRMMSPDSSDYPEYADYSDYY